MVYNLVYLQLRCFHAYSMLKFKTPVRMSLGEKRATFFYNYSNLLQRSRHRPLQSVGREQGQERIQQNPTQMIDQKSIYLKAVFIVVGKLSHLLSNLWIFSRLRRFHSFWVWSFPTTTKTGPTIIAAYESFIRYSWHTCYFASAFICKCPT